MVSGEAQDSEMEQVSALPLGRAQQSLAWGKGVSVVAQAWAGCRFCSAERSAVIPQHSDDDLELLVYVSNFFLYFYVLIYAFEYILHERTCGVFYAYHTSNTNPLPITFVPNLSFVF